MLGETLEDIKLLKSLGASYIKFNDSGVVKEVSFFEESPVVSRETPVEEPLGLEDIESDLLLAELKRRNEKLLYHSS